MGRDGIGRALHALKCELDAYALSLSCYTRIQLARALERAELGDAVLGARDPLARHRGIELERQPADLGIHLAGERFERLRKTTLADIAPRANDIRYHFDGQRSAHR